MPAPQESCIDSAAVLVALARDGHTEVRETAIPGLVALATNEGTSRMLTHVRDDPGLTWVPNGLADWMFGAR